MSAYNPEKIHPSELPVARKLRFKIDDYYYLKSARDFCKRVLQMPEIDGISMEEYDAIKRMAENNEPWPIPDSVYTREDWHRDREFNPVPGQEIEGEIYEDMYDCMMPYRLPCCKRTQGYDAGFLMGEPNTSEIGTGRQLYIALGKSGNRYYYIGLLPTRVKEGEYE